jgi:hypothetical protein
VLSNATGQRLELTGDIVVNTSTTGAGAEAGLNFYQLTSLSTATRACARIASISTDSYTAGNGTTNDADLAIQTSLNGTLSERARIDASGRLLVGTSSTSAACRAIFQGHSSAATNQAIVFLQRGSTTASNGDNIGEIKFADSAGEQAARIAVACDGTWTSGSSHPGRLVFSTTAAGNSSPTERMRITSDGKLGLGTSSPSSIFHAYGSVNNSVARIENVDASTGYGLFVKAGGTTSGRYVASFQDAAGNTRLHILSSGNVGIGTTSPSTPLHIETATAETEIRLTTTGGNIRLRGFNDDLILNADQHRFNNEDNTTEYARIDNSGRLLVGTSTDVAGGNLMQISAAGGPRLGLNLQDGTVASGQFISAIDFYTLAGFVNEKAASIECYADAAQGSGDKPGRLVFSTTADGASSPTERMRIDSAGNVGIGTESPTFSNGSGLEIEQDGVSTLRLQDSSGLGAVVEIFADDGARSAIYDSRGNSSNHGHEFRINGSPKLNIDSSGRLLVGTTSTANRGDAKHIVQGDVSFGNGGGKAHTIYKETAGLADAGTFDVDLISNTGATCGFGTVFYRQGTNQQVQTFSFAGRQSGVVVQLQDTSVRGSGVSGVTVTFAEVSSAGKIRITNGSGTVLDSVQVTLFLHSTLL